MGQVDVRSHTHTKTRRHIYVMNGHRYWLTVKSNTTGQVDVKPHTHLDKKTRTHRYRVTEQTPQDKSMFKGHTPAQDDEDVQVSRHSEDEHHWLGCSRTPRDKLVLEAAHTPGQEDVDVQVPSDRANITGQVDVKPRTHLDKTTWTYRFHITVKTSITGLVGIKHHGTV